MNLDREIADLLKTHDCVIVPDFGGFVGNYHPARINKVNHRFDPPFKKISFNRHLTHNDGLLAATIAKSEGTSYDNGLSKAKAYSVYLKNTLSQEQQVSIAKVGTLYRNADGTFRFEQDMHGDLLLTSAGLDSFFAKSINRKPKTKVEKVEPKAAPAPLKVLPKALPYAEAKPAASPTHEPLTEAPTEIEAEERKGRFKIAWRNVAAAAVLIPILGYATWLVAFTNVLSKEGVSHYSEFNPFADKICTTFNPRAVSKFEEPRHIEDVVVIKDGAYELLTNTTEPDKTLVVGIKSAPEKGAVQSPLRYHVVGGCFSTKAFAERMVAEYRARGSNASIIDQKGGLYRVSVKSTSTRSEAKTELGQVKQSISGAWILKKEI